MIFIARFFLAAAVSRGIKQFCRIAGK